MKKTQQLFYRALPCRLAKFNLEVAVEKTRILPFGRNSGSKESFDFLGFTFYNGVSRKGYYRVIIHTSKKKLKAKRQEMKAWLRSVMHIPIPDIIAKLNDKLRGHYRYYGVSGNINCLNGFYYHCVRTLHSVLRRRGQKKRITWEKLLISMKQSRIVKPRICVNIW